MVRTDNMLSSLNYYVNAVNNVLYLLFWAYNYLISIRHFNRISNFETFKTVSFNNEH